MADSDLLHNAWRIPDIMWAQIEPLLPPKPGHPRGGRLWVSDRATMEAILYVLYTGIPWKELPRSLGAASTVHRRFQQWQHARVFQQMRAAGLTEYGGHVCSQVRGSAACCIASNSTHR